MAETEAAAETTPTRGSKTPFLVGLLLMLGLGGGGFYAVYSGLILGPGDDHSPAELAQSLPDVSFVPIDPMIISLGAGSAVRHLRFTAQLEVGKPYQADVAMLMPRILDVLNGYLRAVEVSQLDDPTALIRLRAQMLRRVQIVTGEGRVRDLLVTEFVLN